MISLRFVIPFASSPVVYSLEIMPEVDGKAPWMNMFLRKQVVVHLHDYFKECNWISPVFEHTYILY